MKISVVIPMYNEEKIIKDTAQQMHRYMTEKFGDDFEVLFSNDGSLDNSAEAVRSLNLSGIKVVGYDKNHGKGCAVRTAMLEASGDFIMFTDADLAYGTEVVGKLYESYLNSEGADVIIGSRNIDNEGYSDYTFIRKIMSKTYIKIVCIFGGFKISDSQCGCKGFDKAAAKKIFSNCEIDGFAFDLEALMIASKMKMKISEVPVKIINHRESKINIVKDTFKMLSDLRRIKKRVKKLNI